MSRESKNREIIIERIEKILEEEKFKIDAYFFCGFSGGTPNESLKRACEQYLSAVTLSKDRKEETQTLISELEKAMDILIRERGDSVMNNKKNVQELLQMKEWL